MSGKGTGLCECGCGGVPAKWSQAQTKYGVVRGDFRRFLPGHYRKPVRYAACHPQRRVKSLGMCGSCYNAHLVKRTPEKAPHRLEVGRNARKRKRDQNPHGFDKKQRDRVLRHRYGISIEDFDKKEARQGGACAICKRPPTAKTLYVDHDHATGAARDLLCAACNTAVGFVEKDPGRLVAISEYLARHRSVAAPNALAIAELRARGAK